LIPHPVKIYRFSFGVHFCEIDGEPYSSFYLNIIDAFAEFERSLISERTKEGLNRAKSQGKQLGRPKGSKDKNKRRKSGYIFREANKRKLQDENSGVYKSIEAYLN
jgi:DNA invertase Pin-like site-specific DNA recombinase